MLNILPDLTTAPGLRRLLTSSWRNPDCASYFYMPWLARKFLFPKSVLRMLVEGHLDERFRAGPPAHMRGWFVEWVPSLGHYRGPCLFPQPRVKRISKVLLIALAETLTLQQWYIIMIVSMQYHCATAASGAFF